LSGVYHARSIYMEAFGGKFKPDLRADPIPADSRAMVRQPYNSRAALMGQTLQRIYNWPLTQS